MSASLEASLRLDIAQYQAQLAKARGEAKKFRDQLQSGTGGLGKMFAGGLAAGSVLALGKTALDTVVSLDRMRRAMTTMEGSAEDAEKRLELLREVAKLPGIGFEQAVQGDIRLRSVGLSADTSKQALIEFGNALALAGGSAEDLDGVILALGQISAKGKVSAEEINQIAERVPQIRAVMKDVFGTADTEALQKMGISADDFITRTIAGFGKLTRATAGLDESLAEIRQSINTMINDGAAPIVNELVPAFAELTTTLAANKDAFVTLGSAGVQSLRGIAQALGFLNQVGTGVGEGIGRMLGFGGASPNSPEAVNRSAADQAAAADAAAKFGPARRFADVGMGPPAPQVKAAAEASTTTSAPDPKARIEAQREINQLLAAEAALAEKRMADYLSILPPNLQLIEIKREMTRLEQEREGLVGPGLDERRLDIESDLLSLRKQSRDAERDLADEKERAAELAKEEADKATQKSDALAAFQAEMDLINAKIAGNKELVAELQKQADIQQIQQQLMEQAGLSEQDALTKAQQMVAAKKTLQDQANQEGDKSGRIQGYSFMKQGGADAARARAEERVTKARDRVQGQYDKFFGTSAFDRAGPTKNQDGTNPLAATAQRNAQNEAAPAANPQQQTAQQIITLVSQILSAVQ